MKIELGRASYTSLGFNEEYYSAFFSGSGEDFTHHGGLLVVLTDDVSGLDAERKAAGLALKKMGASYLQKSQNETIPQALRVALDEANLGVGEIAESSMSKGAGAVGVSLVAGVINNNALYWRSVGDSRLYCLRNGELIQLTSDHTVAKHLRLRTLMKEEKAEDLGDYQKHDALTSYLGMDPIPEFDANIRPFSLDPGDRLLFCSHEVCRTIGEDRIAKSLTAGAQSAAEELARLARSGESGDEGNVAVAVVAILDREAPQRTEGSQTQVKQLPAREIVLATILAGMAIAFATAAYLVYRNQSDEQITKDLSTAQPAVELQVKQSKTSDERDTSIRRDKAPANGSPQLTAPLQYRDLESNP